MTTSLAAATPSSEGGAMPTLASAGDGRLVYGRHTPPDDAFVIYTADVDGGDERELLVGAELPRWSPDGTKLSVVAERPQGLIFVGMINPDGTDYVQFDSPDPTLNRGAAPGRPTGSDWRARAGTTTTPAATASTPSAPPTAATSQGLPPRPKAGTMFPATTRRTARRSHSCAPACPMKSTACSWPSTSTAAASGW